MLEPHGLDYVIKNEMLTITSRGKADEFLELRVYSLKGVWDGESDEESAERWESLVKDAVGGEWNPDEGIGGSVRVRGHTLIVRQNQRTHREIENLLNQLRRANDAE